ncbi:MAG: phosphohydrolase [Arcobacter sp.]|nr:MAG: phosphohydrolase [Arcobacter sp.]
MSKKQTSYKAIDKRLITEGANIDFTLYETNDAKTQMTLFLQSDSVVGGDKKVYLREVESLYIDATDYDKYQSYAQKHLQSIASNPDIPFSEKANIVYAKASEVMENLFKNPDSLENMKHSQEIVNGFVSLALQDEATLESIMKIAAHDYYTHTHSINVSIYALSLAKFIGLKDKDLEDMGMSSMMHDLGKSKVDAGIINKNGKLTEQEFDTMKGHPQLGYNIAIKMGLSDKRILSGIRDHHEKLDGGGYPNGLKDKQISLFARIIAIADVFDALTTKRSYKDAMSSFEAIGIMKKQMDTHLDMRLVNALVKMCAVKI